MDAISDLNGIPTKISADDGTKHALIEPIHVYLSSLNTLREEILAGRKFGGFGGFCQKPPN